MLGMSKFSKMTPFVDNQNIIHLYVFEGKFLENQWDQDPIFCTYFFSQFGAQTIPFYATRVIPWTCPKSTFMSLQLKLRLGYDLLIQA